MNDDVLMPVEFKDRELQLVLTALHYFAATAQLNGKTAATWGFTVSKLHGAQRSAA